MRHLWLFIGLIMLAMSGQSITVSAQVCGSKTLCGQMSTCAEAVYYLTVCGMKRLDADSDGIPCETICGKTLDVMRARVAAQPFSSALARAPLPPPVPASGNLLVGSAQAAPAKPADQEPSGFQCGTKRTCMEMTSCAEAKFHLTQCGLKRLDGDGDGIPCNGLCVR